MKTNAERAMLFSLKLNDKDTYVKKLIAKLLEETNNPQRILFEVKSKYLLEDMKDMAEEYDLQRVECTNSFVNNLNNLQKQVLNKANVDLKVNQLQELFDSLTQSLNAVRNADRSVFTEVGLTKEEVQLLLSKLIRGSLKSAASLTEKQDNSSDFKVYPNYAKLSKGDYQFLGIYSVYKNGKYLKSIGKEELESA